MADVHRLWVGALLALVVVTGACSADSSTATETDLEVFGPWRGDQADSFREVLAAFTEQTGIKVRYTGTANMTGDLEERLSRAAAPDVAVLSQPSVIRELFVNGFVKGLPDEVMAVVADNHREDAAEMTAIDGIPNAVWIRASVKNLVWYRPDVFDEGGYQVPRSWGDLLSLSQQIQDDGLAPWCMGLSAFEASGWPGTDWVEEIVLGAFPIEVYDDWVAGQIPFTDEDIRAAVDLYATVALTRGWTLGGRRSILNTSTSAAILPLLEDPPECGLYRQASFAAQRLPSGVEIGPDADVDVFLMPGFPGVDPPLHVGGDFAVALRADADVWSLMTFLASPVSAQAWPETAGNFTPQRTFDPAEYDDPFSRRVSGLLAGADAIRFDGSDQMPAAVGRAFNEGMVQLIATGNVEAVTAGIQTTADAAADLFRSPR